MLTAHVAEIFPTHIRPQGVAWALVGTFLSTLVYVEAAPTALANIKWRYYMIFVALSSINIVVVYFWCPEVSTRATRIRWLMGTDQGTVTGGDWRTIR